MNTTIIILIICIASTEAFIRDFAQYELEKLKEILKKRRKAAILPTTGAYQRHCRNERIRLHHTLAAFIAVIAAYSTYFTLQIYLVIRLASEIWG